MPMPSVSDCMSNGSASDAPARPAQRALDAPLGDEHRGADQRRHRDETDRVDDGRRTSERAWWKCPTWR